MSLRVLTDAAFESFRTTYSALKQVPLLLQEASQMIQMSQDDGLAVLQDGPALVSEPGDPAPDISEAVDRANIVLWVVRPDDVVHARENCPFGRSVKGGKAKHSNLTGGQPAHSAGEVLFRQTGIAIINGNSGRYGPQSNDEMMAVEVAFSKSGYETWTTGWDHEAEKPVPFFLGNLKRAAM